MKSHYKAVMCLAIACLFWLMGQAGSVVYGQVADGAFTEAATFDQWELPIGATLRPGQFGTTLNYVAMNHRGAWVFITGQNGYQSKSLPKALIDALAKANSSREVIQWVAIGDKSEWILVSDKFIRSGSLANNARTALKAIIDAGDSPTYAAFTRTGGWVIGVGSNGYRSAGIPAGALDALKDLNARNEIINGVSFTANNGYVVWYGANAAKWSGIPKDLSDKLKEVNRRGESIRLVMLYQNNGWLVLYGTQGISGKSLPSALTTAIQKTK